MVSVHDNFKQFNDTMKLKVNPLKSGVAYLYPLKTSKPKGFLMFSGGIDKQHRRAAMG